MTTIGKYRHLQQSSTPGGHFTVLAIDHRANLKAALDKHAPAPLTDAQFTDFKRQIMRYLLPQASAVLTDPDYGISVGITEGHIHGQVGLLAPLEVTNYDLHPRERITRFIENWSVEKIKRVGGTGVKLLLYYHPEDSLAADKRELVSRIVDDCARYDIPFFLEPIAYSLDSSRPLDNAELRQVVVENARVLSRMGVDILKMEFPLNVAQERDEAVWLAAAQELNAACAVPWTLLSGGVDYETFRHQARIACQAGASGVIAGRAIWGEAVQLQGEARENFLKHNGHIRMKELAALCAASAADWRQKVAAPEVGVGWYM
jgi:tagatose 1,6-diphosphate aldolase